MTSASGKKRSNKAKATAKKAREKAEHASELARQKRADRDAARSNAEDARRTLADYCSQQNLAPPPQIPCASPQLQKRPSLQIGDDVMKLIARVRKHGGCVPDDSDDDDVVSTGARVAPSDVMSSDDDRRRDDADRRAGSTERECRCSPARPPYGHASRWRIYRTLRLASRRSRARTRGGEARIDSVVDHRHQDAVAALEPWKTCSRGNDLDAHGARPRTGLVERRRRGSRRSSNSNRPSRGRRPAPPWSAYVSSETRVVGQRVPRKGIRGELFHVRIPSGAEDAHSP